MATAKDDSKWGDQLNVLIDAQINAAQQLDDDILEEVISWEWHTRRPGDDAPD